MFGIQVSFYFINSLLTITIFQSLLLLLLLQRKWKGEEHVTFLLSFCSVVCSSRQMPCCPGLLWGAAHVKRLEELLTKQILVPFYGIFSSRFFCFSVLVQCLIEQGFLWQEQTSVIASWRTGFFFCLTAHSRPGRPALLVQCLIIRGYCRAVSSERLGSVVRHLLVQTSYIQKDR